MLQAASNRGCKTIAKLLIEKGADVNGEGGDYGNALQGGLYCPPQIPAGIWAIPGIPEESILAEGPAKLIQ